MHGFSWVRIMVCPGLGGAVQFRLHTVVTLDRPCYASFGEAQNAVNKAIDQRRWGNVLIHNCDDV